MKLDGTQDPTDGVAIDLREARSRRLQTTAIAALALAAVAIGGGIMVQNVNAADPVASPPTSAGAAASTEPGASSAPAATDEKDGSCSRGADAAVVAGAIGITEAELTTALNSGQTIAEVAAANNVDVQVVIDAIVAEEQSELDAKVADGSLTQGEADAKAADLVQRATDRVNGTFERDGRGGGRHHQDAGDAEATDDATTPTASPAL